MRVAQNLAGLGASKKHKGVLVGDTIEDVTATDFTPRGVALKPFSPTDVTGYYDGSDFTISWVRRGRIGQELVSGLDIPLSEETERYEVDIMDGVSVVRTLPSLSPSVVYSGAQMTEDWGTSFPDLLTVRVYQLSATVGRGYYIEVVL